MKRLLLITVISVMSSFGLIANQAVDNPTLPPKPIVIKPGPTTPPDIIPLTLETDIEASYWDGAVSIVFNVDLGVADIVITNHNTGEQWYGICAGAGGVVIPTSTDAGYYTITISTANMTYSGEFSL